jgi:hypothetical protein
MCRVIIYHECGLIEERRVPKWSSFDVLHLDGSVHSTANVGCFPIFHVNL